MHRITTLVSLMILICGPISVAQQPVVSPRVSEATPPSPTAHRPPGGRPSADPNQGHPMTNDEVVKLVKSGVPESVIVASIQSSPNNFDLSSGALIGLRKAGVNQKILDAMKAANGGDGGVSSALLNAAISPSPVGPTKHYKPTLEQSKAALAKLKARTGHLSPMISNPKAVEAEAPTIAVLMKQKQAIQSGRIMSATGDPAGGQSTPPGTPGTPGGNPNPNNPVGGSTNPNPNNPTGSPSNPSPGNPPGGPKLVGGLPSNPAGGSSRTANTNARAVAMAPNAIPAPQSAGSSAGSRMVLHQNTSIDACMLPGTTPVIKGLNAQEYNGPAVFSQDPLYNPFWIDGCHFGNIQGRAYVNSSSGQKLADLIINSWTDTVLKATVDPSVIDVFDQDNVTLVIVPASGQQGQKSGFKFYAMRREVLLSDIPKSQVSLARVTDTGGSGVIGSYSSPYTGLGYSHALQLTGNASPAERATVKAEGLNGDEGMTAGADRNAEFRFSGGTDVYDFTKLKPGFYVSRFQIDERNLQVCTYGLTAVSAGDESDYRDGSWNAQFSLAESKIRVDWAEQHCHLTNGNDSSNSTYALNVWVKGPAMRPQASPWQEGVK